MKTQPSGIGYRLHHYNKLNIKKGSVAIWEDGLRSGMAAADYEWWYFDSHLSDGSKLVIVFYTKPQGSTKKGYAPQATLEWDTPDGRSYMEKVTIPADAFEVSKDRCNVKIGNCYFEGDLDHYNIHFENEKISATVRMRSTVPAWRPGTGHIFFGDGDKEYFAWLPAVPEGDLNVEIKEADSTTHLTGTGYHDHNWGNAPMMNVMHHWYWGRAKIGPYQVISSYITGEKKFGYAKYPIFMLAKDGKIVADNADEHLKCVGSDIIYDERTKKPVCQRLIYDYNDGTDHYRVTYRQKETMIHASMLEGPNDPGVLIRTLAKLMGFSGAYHRFSGEATVEKLNHSVAEESYTAPAMWELMYFGKANENNP